MLASLKQGRFFGLAIILLCFAYFVFQLINNQYATWAVDDFWFAHHIYKFKDGIPYYDFSPYKTVLGYYFLLPTMTLGHDAITPLQYTKNFIALLNAGLFALTGVWLSKYFSKSAILITLALLMFTTFVLNYSTNIRVDLLAYWLCLFSALFLLDNKFIWAGVLLGVAFATSQKIVWYLAASDIALGIYWVLIARNKKIFWGAVAFNLVFLLSVAIYLGIWSWLAGFHNVMSNVFYEAYIMFQLDTYDSTRRFFWQQILISNPFVFLLCAGFIITLFVSPRNDKLLDKRIFIATYAAVILFCLIPYKQVFPYYMLTTLPAFILLYTAFFSWLFELLQDSTPPKLHLIDSSGVWGLIAIYLFYFIYMNICFVIPPICLLIGVIPILIGLKITSTSRSTLSVATPALITIIIFFLGLLYPLTLSIQTIWRFPGNYQRSMTQLTETLLQSGGDYLAGIELIYNKNQPIPGLRHLDAPGLVYLYHPSPKLAPTMLASLDHTPDITIEKAIYALDASSVKFYLNNYRINALPDEIKNYLSTHYAHFWGSIYLYAPTVKPGKRTVDIKFSGDYLMTAKINIQLDAVTVKPHTIIKLEQGRHISNAATTYRLKLQEKNLSAQLNPTFEKDNSVVMF
jgi:hypothetical protein